MQGMYLLTLARGNASAWLKQNRLTEEVVEVDEAASATYATSIFPTSTARECLRLRLQRCVWTRERYESVTF